MKKYQINKRMRNRQKKTIKESEQKINIYIYIWRNKSTHDDVLPLTTWTKNHDRLKAHFGPEGFIHTMYRCCSHLLAWLLCTYILEGKERTGGETSIYQWR